MVRLRPSTVNGTLGRAGGPGWPPGMPEARDGLPPGAFFGAGGESRGSFPKSFSPHNGGEHGLYTLPMLFVSRLFLVSEGQKGGCVQLGRP